MVLSDNDILKRYHKGQRLVEPFDIKRLQPASIDMVLDSTFLVCPTARTLCDYDKVSIREPYIDLKNVRETLAEEPLESVDCDYYRLDPGDFCLASTAETVDIPDDLVARVEGKSSLGRIGLLIHATAGFIDPGFRGKITLELCNLNYRPIVLRPGRAVCQLSILQLSSPAERPYGHPDLGSKYQDQVTVTGSHYAG